MRNLAVALLTGCVLMLGGCSGYPADYAPAAKIAIQANGRVKTLDAFARSTLELVAGKERWKKKSALENVLDVLAEPGHAETEPWIRIDHRGLKTELGLDASKRHFSLKELQAAEAGIRRLTESSREKRDRDVRPSPEEQKAETLSSQMEAALSLAAGGSIRVLPGPDGAEWKSPYLEEGHPLAADFKKITEAHQAKNRGALRAAAGAWNAKIDAQTGGRHRMRLDLERIYYSTRPFQCAWMAYLLAFVLMTGPLRRKKPLFGSSLAALAAGILFHSAGLALRIVILSRPPVSNMYESMIFMNWALILFAVIFSLIRKNPVPAAAGALLSACIMIYSNLLPIDPSLDVLVPVLRSNYWLTIHVMTIVSSYGAFGLAMALSHRHLIFFITDKRSESEAAASADLIYRVMQIGVLLLGIGTVLGGVWANESWGRFWGWDPKETWALITFLGYLIIVHLRQTGRLSDFATAVGGVLGFLLVLMTWYGVNFVLGRGLHSYGAGSGGMGWVLVYLALEALFIIGVFAKRLRT